MYLNIYIILTLLCLCVVHLQTKCLPFRKHVQAFNKATNTSSWVSRIWSVFFFQDGSLHQSFGKDNRVTARKEDSYNMKKRWKTTEKNAVERWEVQLDPKGRCNFRRYVYIILSSFWNLGAAPLLHALQCFNILGCKYLSSCLDFKGRNLWNQELKIFQKHLSLLYIINTWGLLNYFHSRSLRDWCFPYLKIVIYVAITHIHFFHAYMRVIWLWEQFVTGDTEYWNAAKCVNDTYQKKTMSLRQIKAF